MTFQPNTPGPSAPNGPFNALPPVVIALAVAIGLVEIVFAVTSAGLIGGPELTGLRLTAIEDFGFYEPLFAWMIENQTLRAEFLVRFVTYPFLQAQTIQAVFVVVFVLALGKMVAERMGQWAVLVVFFGASIIGALVYGLVWDTRVPLFGGYPGAYALVGAFTLVLYLRLGETGGRQAQAFTLIGMLLLIQFIFGLFFGAGTAWVAEVAGFVAGFVIAALMYPGSWSALVARLRQRR